MLCVFLIFLLFPPFNSFWLCCWAEFRSDWRNGRKSADKPLLDVESEIKLFSTSVFVAISANRTACLWCTLIPQLQQFLLFPLKLKFSFNRNFYVSEREQSKNTTETNCSIFKLKFAICGYALRVYFVLVAWIAIAFAKQSSDRDTVWSRFRHNLCLFFWLTLRRRIFNQKHKIFRNNADGHENESENVSAAQRYIRWFITITTHVLALF